MISLSALLRMPSLRSWPRPGQRGVGAGGHELAAEPGAGAGEGARRGVVADDAAEELDELAGEGQGVGAVGEPEGGVAAGVEVADAGLELAGSRKCASKKRPTFLRGAGLVRGQECGVRDGQAERAAEERLDGEPVGEAADHAGLGHGADQPQRRGVAADEEGGEEDGDEPEEDAGGEAAGAGERRARRGGQTTRTRAAQGRRSAPPGGRRGRPGRRRRGCRSGSRRRREGK